MPRHCLTYHFAANPWLIPLRCLLGAIGLALGPTAIDRALTTR